MRNIPKRARRGRHFHSVDRLALGNGEGSATAEKSVRDFEFTERFQDFSKDFRFQLIQQKISGFQDFSEDFRFREDFCRDFKISRDFW